MRRYGNVSSSSIWYVLANIETMQARAYASSCLPTWVKPPCSER